MISIDIKLDKNDVKRISDMPREYKKGLKKGLGIVSKFLEMEIKRGFGKANRPKVRTGKLRDSISASSTNTSVNIIVDSVYGRIHEEGGTIKGKPWLIFKVGDKFKKVSSVKIPARPYVEPVVTENLNKVGNIITEEIVKELNRR